MGQLLRGICTGGCSAAWRDSAGRAARGARVRHVDGKMPAVVPARVSAAGGMDCFA